MGNRKIALVGNPNTGKTSVFNRLSGLNQKVGNFSGVTVEKKSAVVQLKNRAVDLLDLPGIYSIYPHSIDEKIVYTILKNKDHADHPDEIYYVADAANLERNLLLFTQLYDLGIPMTLVLNMSDIAAKNGILFDADRFAILFPEVKIIQTNARVGLGIERIKKAMEQDNKAFPLSGNIVLGYTLIDIEDTAAQEADATLRFQKIRSLLKHFQTITPKEKKDDFSTKIDRILTHKVGGYLIFAAILMAIFQLIFSIAAFPMELIDTAFSDLSAWISSKMPSGVLNDLVSQGIIPGLGGVIIFVPQIALLFFCLIILEETGYMSRVIFIMDRLMRPFGLNGKSVVPLMSSAACAIPGIMATRAIPNWKERITTIFVAPFMSCSARIPVYNLLILLVVPKKIVFGFLNLQGLTLFAMYVLGVVAALLAAMVLKYLLPSKEKSFLLLELPSYKAPRWKNVWIELSNKVKSFVIDSGKIILAVSILLWFLASYGPKDRVDNAEKLYTSQLDKGTLNQSEYEYKMASVELENSYIGILGKAIEPAIQPLGYDWKIGISLLTSFAAREVFVGTLATIYSVEDDGEKNLPLLEKLRLETTITGTPVFNFATGLSLMVFYAFAMQCMATLAIVKTETNSWKWPMLQLFSMGALAYIASLIVYQILK